MTNGRPGQDCYPDLPLFFHTTITTENARTRTTFNECLTKPVHRQRAHRSALNVIFSALEGDQKGPDFYIYYEKPLFRKFFQKGGDRYTLFFSL